MSDNMPDFDKMSPEEIMAWMETLAKRQGASEGFTTAADMDIAEIDPNTVVIDEPGYVPYGEERTQPLAPSTPPPAAPPKPADLPAAAAPPTPAPRPAAPVQPPQPPARPATPPLAQPRPSVPSESAPPAPARTVIPPAAQQPPPPTRTQPPTPPPVTRPAAQQPPAVQPKPPVAAAPPTAPAQPPRPVTPPPVPAPSASIPPTPPPASQPVDESALAWLESLAADQGDELFNLDLSDLPSTETPVAATDAVNPMTWLEDLARSQVAEPSLERLGADDDDDEEESEKLDPFAQGVNPIEWLETLAKRQGAKEEELTTRASMNIPAPAEAEVEDDDYQPFSFDTPPTRRPPEPVAAENPADWLNSLAGSEGYSEEGVLATQPAEETDVIPNTMSMSAIEDAISQGTVTREQMQFFLDQQADQLAEQPEEVYEEVEDDGPLAPAELPDWLSELKPSAPPPVPAAPTKPIDALFEAPPVAEMPDWLKQDLLGDTSSLPDIDSIFQVEEDSQTITPLPPVNTAPVAPPYEIEVDASDPWVEAFDEEYAQGGMADIDAVPAWYEQNISDPTRIAAVEDQTEVEEVNALEDAALPEENALAEGQPQAVPSWMSGFEAVGEAETVEEEPADNVFSGEMPDWLKEVESEVAPEDVPDWLVETIGAPEEVDTIFLEPIQQEPPVVIEPPAPVAPPPRPAPAPVAAAPKPAAPAAAPRPAAVATGEAAAVIERARDKEQSGDLEGALAEYESMIRSNAALDAVVEELTQLVKSYKTTPAVYRVLGDGLMRQGKLQAALNTYREALNQL